MTTRTSFPATAAVICVLLTGVGCERPASDAPPAAAATTDSAGGVQSNSPLIPATAGLDRVNDLVRDPARDPLPRDTVLAAMIRLGHDIMRDTPGKAAAYSGNDLSCANCHLNVGQKDAAWPLVGVAGLFPQYRSRSGRLITLEDRIRDCFQRSMNGKAPAFDSREVLAVSAYIAWISEGIPTGKDPAWRGRNTIVKEKQIAIDSLDPVAGRALFEKSCVACHGADGQGINLGTAHPGPLWGPRSWNDGAGAARVYTLAGYIRYAMPLTAPGSLTDADAQNIAAYIESQDRPRFADKAHDYPDGKIPVDAVYYPQKYSTNPLRR